MFLNLNCISRWTKVIIPDILEFLTCSLSAEKIEIPEWNDKIIIKNTINIFVTTLFSQESFSSSAEENKIQCCVSNFTWNKITQKIWFIILILLTEDGGRRMTGNGQSRFVWSFPRI